ncbi:hypothetical protein BGX34_012202 [Mortierella sp. NVP85]|nr:hypothetical protein BGX34_012202 [Mortierella sp. NVP85]
MTSTHAIEIQEIADLVASYLEVQDLTACICASKIWRDMFLPHRWRIIRIRLEADDDGIISPIGPDQDAIYSHRHMIQDLSLFGKVGVFVEHQFPNVRRLMVNMYESKHQNDGLIMDLTTKTPILVDLTLVAVIAPSDFWDTLSKHPHLRHLYLAHLIVKVDDAPGLWKTCMKLESLQMHYVGIEEGGRPENVVFDGLRQLHLTSPGSIDDKYVLDLMIQSPMLESLELDISDYGFLRDRRANGNWPHLKKLLVDGCIRDAELNFIFKRVENDLGSTASLEPYRSGLHTQALKTAGSHFSTLVDVNLANSVTFSKSTIPDILCYCPRLENLQAGSVLARSVAERGPWACQQLRELRIQFLIDPLEQSLKQLIFERLSTLVLLEQLTLDYTFSRSARHYDMLECRLDCGLGRLACLHQLNYIWLCTPNNYWRSPNLGMEDVVWMVENWRKLETVRGHLNKDGELTVRLKSVFESHGISVER